MSLRSAKGGPQQKATRRRPTPITQPPSSTPQDRIAEIVLKVIAAGGLAAGGAGAFWQILKDDGSIPKAIVSGVVGLGIAYGANLLMPIHRGNEERVEEEFGTCNVRRGIVSPIG